MVDCTPYPPSLVFVFLGKTYSLNLTSDSQIV
jgi:hypothetical protein